MDAPSPDPFITAGLQYQAFHPAVGNRIELTSNACLKSGDAAKVREGRKEYSVTE
jgi:hypothetical protein